MQTAPEITDDKYPLMQDHNCIGGVLLCQEGILTNGNREPLRAARPAIDLLYGSPLD